MVFTKSGCEKTPEVSHLYIHVDGTDLDVEL